MSQYTTGEMARLCGVSVRTGRLRRLEEMQREMKKIEHFTVDAIGDIAHMVENKHKLRRVRRNMILIGLLMDAIETAALMLWMLKGVWWPFVIAVLAVTALGVWVSGYYWHSTAYICPECHTVFKPGFKEALFARHTPNTRRLTCPRCGHFGFCVETYGGEKTAC